MEIIKEVVKINENRYRYVIRTDTYNSSFGHFSRLFRIAKETFPNLTEEEVEIVQYGGNYAKYTFGIEWNSEIEPSEMWSVGKNTICTLR